MTLVFFVLNVLTMFAMIAMFLAPVGLLIRAAKRRALKAAEPVVPEYIAMPDYEYKVNVRAAKKYLKSRGIVVA
jgi:hypothetical protein